MLFNCFLFVAALNCIYADSSMDYIVDIYEMVVMVVMEQHGGQVFFFFFKKAINHILNKIY